MRGGMPARHERWLCLRGGCTHVPTQNGVTYRRSASATYGMYGTGAPAACSLQWLCIIQVECPSVHGLPLRLRCARPRTVAS